jgi:hypothetical protein
VVATTGGRDVSQLKVDLPTNTFVAEYIPHDLLLSKVDVMVTNGGRFLAAARTLETAFARRNDVAEIAALVDEVIGEHSRVAQR